MLLRWKKTDKVALRCSANLLHTHLVSDVLCYTLLQLKVHWSLMGVGDGGISVALFAVNTGEEPV